MNGFIKTTSVCFLTVELSVYIINNRTQFLFSKETKNRIGLNIESGNNGYPNSKHIMRKLLLIAFVLQLSFSVTASNFTIYTVADGNWNNPNTWNLNRIPNASDHVLINYDIYINNGSATIDSLTIENNLGNSAGLLIHTFEKFTISGGLQVFCLNTNRDSYFILEYNADVEVGGDVYMRRSNDVDHIYTASFIVDHNATFFTPNNFIYDYGGAVIAETKPEIYLLKEADFTVDKDIVLNGFFGNELNLTVIDSVDFDCNGNLYLNNFETDSIQLQIWPKVNALIKGSFISNNNTNPSSDIRCYLYGAITIENDMDLTALEQYSNTHLWLLSDSSEIIVGGDLNINAVSEGDISITMEAKSELYLKGGLTRAGGYGKLNMSQDATWIYAGSNQQTIACTEGNGSDVFNFNNVKFQNTSGLPMLLDGLVSVFGELDISSTLLDCDSTHMFVIEDGASVIGGSTSSYINGPLKKNSLTGTDPFTFPIGHNGKYAPMTIESTGSRAAGGEFTASFLSCPPPWGDELAVNLDQISDEDHWTLDRSVGAVDVNVSLHWSDAEAQGINDLSSLVVAMYNPDATIYTGFPEGWTSIGNGGTSGGTGSGVSGSISNIGTCPPPWGIQNFTLGSTDAANALPLELEGFDAMKNGKVVDLIWNSINETNTVAFIIEKSINGSDYFSIDRQKAKKISGGTEYYTLDKTPVTGTNYYRIKQLDLDGMFSYSNVLSVNFTPENNLSIFPNPINDHCVLRGELLKGAREIRISDLAGKIISVMVIENHTDILSFNLSENNIINPGFYLVTVHGQGQDQTIKIYKN